MPATKFICPNGHQVLIKDCLNHCIQKERCMFLPTLRAIAKSLDRNIKEPTVTELISGVRETYLKKTTEYAVDPQSTLYALQGQAIHTLNENCTDGEILSEIRLKDQITSGKFDLYGKILDEEEGVLGDLKVTSSYKLMKALGIYKKQMQTGEVYKSGLKKGQPKTKAVLFYDGHHHVLDWAIQLNYYRILLEKEGFEVKKMFIQAICRDSNLRMAAERGITQAVYIISINKISDFWMDIYFSHKAKLLKTALDTHTLPEICSAKERWNDRKCLDYCNCGSNCPYGLKLKLDRFTKIS